ncbi:PAS domain S-box protein [Proteiniclasticum sp.]|uniref:PAS domain S-box protein n=1 Tax=Proteiniclasticum sp. TaxID=2053595 RepID=UPI00289D501E|nr:PAS domain S-box protein [Proteiniclasticum sp.]
MEKSNFSMDNLWNSIMDFSSSIIQSIDVKGEFLYTNQTWRDTLGYSDEEILIKNIWTVLSKRSHPAYVKIINMVIEGIEPGHQDLTYIKKNGDEIILSGTISILKDEYGQPIGTTEFMKLSAYVDEPYNLKVPIHSLQDQTEYVREYSYDGNMLLGLEDQDSPINRFLDSIYDLVFFKDIHGVYRGCNSNFAALLNLPKGKILGRDDYDLYPKEVADMFTSKDKQILNDLTPRKNEEWVRKSDGTNSFIETLKTPYWGPDNKLIGFLGISRDITERKLAEEKLAENEMWLNIYFTQSLSAKFFLMLDTPVIWDDSIDKKNTLKQIYENLKMNRINPAMTSLYGKSEEEITASETPAAFFCDMHDGFKDWMELLDRSHLNTVTKKQRANGEFLYVSGDYTCLYDHDGLLMGIFGNQRDITKEMLAEEESKERELYLRTVLETTRDGYFAMDEELNIIDVNEAYCRMSGYTRDDLIGMNINEHTVDNDKVSTMARVNRIFKTGSELFETRHRRRDGTFYDVEISVSTLAPSEMKLICFVRDITERKQLESYFLIEKDLFKNTIHSAADAVISTDAEGKVVIMNSMAESMTGWTQDEATDKRIEDVFNNVDGSGNQLQNVALKSIAQNKTIEITEDCLLSTKDNRKIFIELSAAPITGSENDIIGAVVMFKDITKRREEMKNIEDLSFRDALTGLNNRRYLDEALTNLNNDLSYPLTIMVVDVNGLKLTNDAFGHTAGDALLKAVAKICREVTRNGDIVCRTGGDEFVLILPNSDRAQAKALKDRIVSLASKTNIDSLSVSLAIGYSVMRSAEEQFEDVFTEADNNMYRNKLRYGKTVKKKTIDKLINKLNRKHGDICQHNRNVARYSEALANAINLSAKEIEDIRLAASLHDIGKVMVSKDVLQKQEKLSDKEMNQIRKHSEIGYQLLKEVDDYKHLAEIVLSHHEWWNGLGYPRNLKEKQIPLLARIIAVTDAYETMIGKRNYKESIGKDEAIKELKACAGTQFDPELVELFVNKVIPTL